MWLFPALAISITSLLFSPTSWASVGRVVEQTGPTEIVRNKRSTPSAVNTPVEMMDTVVTARAKARLEFVDKTTVNITEQSKITIDEFVYDPKAGSGKLAMKMVQGTARYASGQIAKNSPQNVNVTTPTATVAVRGTDFSMTVDELGRSLVMLLPSCDNRGCVTGAILVSNDAGSVLMDVAYQTTVVTSLTTAPSSPVIVTIDQANINNLLIVAPPPEITTEDERKKQSDTRTALDVNFLNRDLLKYDELDQDELKKFVELEINFLDVDLLVNMLDLSNQQLAASQEAILAEKTLLPGYSPASGLTYGISDDESRLILRRQTTHTAQVIVDREHDAMLNITQDGTPLTQQINRGGTAVITIIQR
jgi:FecR protein